jgi:PAS domain S-box-containing protein
MKDNICPKPIQRLLSHSRDLLIVFDNNGKEIYISDTLQKLLGYPVSEIAEKSFMHIIHPADKANLQARLHKLNIEKDASIFTELIIKHKNGQNLVFTGIAINETDETDETHETHETHNNHIYLFLRNISSIKKLENELQETYLKQKEIKKYGVEAREKERKTFAAFLHDEIGQALTAIKICLGRISANIESRSDTLAGIDKMIKLINNTIEETQHINYELRPNLTDKLGFAPAIRTYCNDWKERTGINVKLLIDTVIVNNNAALALFRII